VSAKRRILVVDDAEGIRSYLASLLELRDFHVDTAEDGRSALALLESGAAPDLIILDVMMPGIDGLETLRRIRARDAELPVVMLSVVGKAGTIVEAMRLGATDYLNKPFEEEELELTICKAFERRDLEAECQQLRTDLGPEAAAEATVWEGETLERIRELLAQIADTDVNVLIQGESGVGKEIVARAVHSTSERKGKPFVKVNCAALPAELLESELFGYEKGAFTGANARKQGRFEHADGGTIFLDEIGEMSSALQAKLLQVLQDGTFTRLGANREVKVDVRVVTATNRPLEEMVAGRAFREDLFFRLNVVNIQIPPLRERREEIPRLVDHFLRRLSARYGKRRMRVSSRLLSLFDRYSFPGNIRELENMIKRIVVLESEEPVVAELLSRGERGVRSTVTAFQSLLEEVEESAGELPLREVGRRASLEVERETIERVLLQTNWNRKRAARLLHVSYKTLLQKIRECGLGPASPNAE
jgi:two-component system response regulator AtoC